MADVTGTITTTPSAPASPVAAPEAAAQQASSGGNVAPLTAETASPRAPDAAAVSAPAAPEAAKPTAPEAVKPVVTSTTDKPAEVTALGAEPPKAEVKPAEVKTEESKKDVKAEAEKPVEQKKEDGDQSDKPAPLPTYEAFKLPEGLNFDKDRFETFTKELGEFEMDSKADHAKLQAFGQKLVDRHIAETQDAMKRMNEYYASSFEKQKSEWKDAFEKDPEIGGNRRDTTVRAALEFVRTHGGDEGQQKEFAELMNKTGVGNHPALIRLLAKANTALREGSPLPAPKPASSPASKVERRYGKT